MASQPLAFGALLIAGIIGEAAIKNVSPAAVVQGTAPPLSTGTSAASPAASAAASAVTVGDLGFGGGANPTLTSGDNPRGTAIVNAVPAAVTAAYNRARDLLGVPYVYGGGHSVAALTESVAQIKATTGLDCSALVDNILGPKGAGVLTTAPNTSGLASAPQLVSGAGQYITVYDDATGAGGLTHAFIQIGDQFFQAPETGESVQLMSPATVKALLTQGVFLKSHPVGL
jgi:cell wall-associated NlpC family hydrolase